MNILLVTSLFVFTFLSEAQDFDKPFLICDWKEDVEKAVQGNKKEPFFSLPTTAPKKEITAIYEWNAALENLVNLQIRLELIAFYNYLAMARFFHKYDQEREGFAKYFRNAASEELEHSEMFMKYQQMRGGKVEMEKIPAPEKKDWRTAKDVMETAFLLEKNVTDEILCLHNQAARLGDTDFLNFLEDKIIPEQYESMKEIKTHIKNLARACPDQKECAQYPLYELQYDMKLKGEK